MPPMGRQTFGGRIKYRPLNLVKGVSTFVETLFTVEDDDGQVIFTKRDAKTGTFAFTAEQGIYQYCFINSLKVGSEGLKHSGLEEVQRTGKVTLEVDANNIDYSEIATRENLEPIEIELRKLEDAVLRVNQEFEFQNPRAEELHSTNESTASRMEWLSIISFVVLVLSIVFQLYYLKSFLRQKKVIS
eukprot:TRINITY_DN2338_c0_g2_i11.p1 TRINITY_DN2338_c0_g2~~TRINITY_DN2338_c0_g2_i11.p1  ORF type:complete len:187 (+),score=23.52 TRINITY_DN2338_c0_g2_i11:330-890(+)